MKFATLFLSFWLTALAGFGQHSDTTLTRSARGFPATLPDVRYHLTARPWQPLNIADTLILDKAEQTVRAMAPFLDSTGAIIDPYTKREVQYATPYFAGTVGILLASNRAADLLPAGVRAMNKSTAYIAAGLAAIPDQHAEFFLAPVAAAIPLYTPFIADTTVQLWRQRMNRPITQVIRGLAHNWRTYAMKGEWLRARNGYVPKSTAVSWIESSWKNTQAWRFNTNVWNFYHDQSSDPLPWAYESVARSNLLSMIADGYDGPSRNAMLAVIKKSTRSTLLVQDPTGQAPPGGRSSNHTWNDLLLSNAFDLLAEMEYKEGNTELAGQYRRAASLSFQSTLRWQRSDGAFSVTKNHFNPALRVGYASYSHYTNYNGNMLYHLAESFLVRKSKIPEVALPTEIGGFTLTTDSVLSTAFANAGGMQLTMGLKGSSQSIHNQFWSTLGVNRFSRAGWDARLGPSDGVREALSKLGVTFAPTFFEHGNWRRLASMPERYEAFLTTRLAHPLLVRCRLTYRPRPGFTGPTFANDFTITPDGVLSTLSGSLPVFGITWPLLTFDGATQLSTALTTHIASTGYPTGTDRQNFIALHPAPVFGTTDGLRRSSYGDLQPIRMVSGSSVNKTFVYPSTAKDPPADWVRASFRDSAGNFESILGRVTDSLYVGRTAAGGFADSLDLDQDGRAELRFNKRTGFVAQLEAGEIRALETEQALTASLYGQQLDLQAYTPKAITNPALAVIDSSWDSFNDGNIPANTFDKEYSTRWSSPGRGQHLNLRLDTTINLQAVRIAWFRGNERRYFFSVQVSLNGSSWVTISNDTSSGTTVFPETYRFAPRPARFVRLVCRGNNLNTWNAITEVVVYKVPQTPAAVAPAQVVMQAKIPEMMAEGLADNSVVWPNPGRDIFYLRAAEKWQGATLLVHDVQGRLVLQTRADRLPHRINLAGKAKGVYFITLQKDGKQWRQQIVRQ